MFAEQAYLFRHALLREAAYQLQLPGDRARLHALAFEIIEALHGGLAPEPPPLENSDPPPMQPHPTDAVADELVTHAKLARTLDDGPWSCALRLYTRRLAEHAQRRHLTFASAGAWLELAGMFDGRARARALLNAGVLLARTGHTTKALPMMEESLALFREAGAKRDEGIVLGNLSALYESTGNVEPAIKHVTQCLEIYKAIGYRRGVPRRMAGLALLYSQQGDLVKAEFLFNECLTAMREGGDTEGEAEVLANLGILSGC